MSFMKWMAGARIDRAPGAALAGSLRQQGSFLGVTVQES